MKRVINRKGSVTLEAALILPVLILAVLSLGYYINVYSVMENVSYAVIEETARLSANAYNVKVRPWFSAVLEKRVCEENPGLEDFKTRSFRYLYNDGDLDDMISVSCNYSLPVNLPAGFGHVIDADVRVKSRGFTGVMKNGDVMTVEEMESEGVWEPVWIFPLRGEKFHSHNCTYVKGSPEEMVLTRDLARSYDPCELCKPYDSAVGSYVYCFPDEGTVYHKENCRQVSRYTVEINKEDALRKGFSPCSKCGGG